MGEGLPPVSAGWAAAASSFGCGQSQVPSEGLRKHRDSTVASKRCGPRGHFKRQQELRFRLTPVCQIPAGDPFLKCAVSNILTLTSLKRLPISGKNPTIRQVLQYFPFFFFFDSISNLFLFRLQKHTNFRVSAPVLPQPNWPFISQPSTEVFTHLPQVRIWSNNHITARP